MVLHTGGFNNEQTDQVFYPWLLRSSKKVEREEIVKQAFTLSDSD